MTIKFLHYVLSENKIFTICTIKTGTNFSIGYSIFSENTKININKRGGSKTNWAKKVSNDLAIKKCYDLDLSFDIKGIKEFLGTSTHSYANIYSLFALKEVIFHLKKNRNYNYTDTIDELYNILCKEYAKYIVLMNEKFLKFFVSSQF